MASRFRASEITLGRAVSAGARRIIDIPHAVGWEMGWGLAAENRARLKRTRDRHAGARCVVIANGPSVATMDLGILEGEITFSMNRAYLLYGDRIPVPTYFTCINELVLEQFHSDIGALPMAKFLNWNRRALFDAGENLMFVRAGLRLRDRFQEDILQTISSGGTVTFATLQIAYYMGFREVILIGLDHSFAETGTPNRTEIRTTTVDASHCHPNYFPKGTKWQLPDLLRSEVAYTLARRAFEARGGRIVDATVGGKCQVFEKGDLAACLRNQ